MAIRLSLTAAVTTVSLVAIGCGGSASSSSKSTPSRATSTPAAPGSTTTPSATTTSNSTTPAAGLAQGIAQCKATIAAAPTLSADAKHRLESLCNQAASGSTANLRKQAAQVCQEIVKASVPPSQQQAALTACPKP